MDYLGSLKNIYKLNETQLNYLHKKLVSEDLSQISVVKDKIDSLIKQQLTIKGRIPEKNYNTVNNFLIETYSVINSIMKHIPKQRKVDPYELYGYDKNQKIDLQELKAKFKKFAFETHPDKNNGDDRNFILVNEAFKTILEDLKMKEKDKQYTELKNNSHDFINAQNNSNMKNTKMLPENFDINKFNKVYSENRIKDVTDDGYANWARENKDYNEEIQKNKNLNKDNFNRIFDSNVKMSNDIIKYETPKSLFMNDENNVQELGIDKIDNYSGKTKTIQYTDFKEAHTTSRLVDPNAKIKEYKNIGELKKTRSNISNFTEDELKKIEQREELEKLNEHKRLESLKKYDAIHARNFERVNNIMLN